jgi:hypothetical protein
LEQLIAEAAGEDDVLGELLDATGLPDEPVGGGGGTSIDVPRRQAADPAPSGARASADADADAAVVAAEAAAAAEQVAAAAELADLLAHGGEQALRLLERVRPLYGSILVLGSTKLLELSVDLARAYSYQLALERTAAGAGATSRGPWPWPWRVVFRQAAPRYTEQPFHAMKRAAGGGMASRPAAIGAAARGGALPPGAEPGRPRALPRGAGGRAGTDGTTVV